ncbi:MAG: prolyl oligopeptidase family serine peptidase, partial [Pseudomonadota bacterium]
MRRIIALFNSCFLVLIFFAGSYAQQPVSTLDATEAEELLDFLKIAEGTNDVASCIEGEMPSGALYRICLPEAWNGWLVVYAHGYVRPDAALQIPPEAEFIAPVLSKMGAAFGVTSYRTNGFTAGKWGQEDVLDVIDVFSSLYAVPDRVLVAGASLGGGVAAKLAEDHPDIFSGVLGLCCASSINIQLNHHYDFRVVFDYFFPGLIPGSAIRIPQEVMENWDAAYAPVVAEALLTQT